MYLKFSTLLIAGYFILILHPDDAEFHVYDENPR